MASNIEKLMIEEGMTLDAAEDIDDYLTSIADYSARIQAVEPYLNGVLEMPKGLQLCLRLATKRNGMSVGVMVDAIDLWLRNDKDADKTIFALNLTKKGK